MFPTPKSYTVVPGVVRADQQTTVTVLATERAFLFEEGRRYDLIIVSVNADDSYYEPTSHQKLSLEAHGGVLRFEHTFAGEGEHRILLYRDEELRETIPVYSLREDLYALRPLKGDFHAHSYRSDGKRDPAAEAGHYREQGYDFYALTDHNRFYPGGEIDEVYAGVNTGFARVYGEEIHCPGSVVHIVHAGGKQSVTERYVHDRENYEHEIADYVTRVPQTVPAQYRERYAKAMWATDEIHRAGGLAIFPHPYWCPGRSMLYNVNDEFARILLMSGMFDAYELVGGMGQVGNNRSVSLWADLRAEGLKISVVGSSDVHKMEKSVEFPHLFTVCFAEKNENDSIVDAVRRGMSVAVEASGTEYGREYRCYGSLRLVSYAQFLLKNYFHDRMRILQGEGVAMRAYAMEEVDAKTVELQAEQAERFALRYFGKADPVLPSQRMLDFEERWRAVHVEGPVTKGSAIDSDKILRQI